MLPRVDWLKPADILILFFLSEHRWRLAAPPATIGVNTGLSNSHANSRLRVLENAGIVERVDEEVEKTGYYRITEFGERLVLGQVSADELRDLEPSE